MLSKVFWPTVLPIRFQPDLSSAVTGLAGVLSYQLQRLLRTDLFLLAPLASPSVPADPGLSPACNQELASVPPGKSGEFLPGPAKPSEYLKPDIPEPDVALGDEEGVPDLDHVVRVDVGLFEPVGAGVRLLLESHDLLEYEEGVGLVYFAILVGVPEEDRGGPDVAGFRGG